MQRKQAIKGDLRCVVVVEQFMGVPLAGISFRLERRCRSYTHPSVCSSLDGLDDW